jgi:hypothetical protein
MAEVFFFSADSHAHIVNARPISEIESNSLGFSIYLLCTNGAAKNASRCTLIRVHALAQTLIRITQAGAPPLIPLVKIAPGLH